MKKAMNKNDGEILKFIKNTMLKHYPIEEDRIDKVLSSNSSRFDIVFSFFQNEEKSDVTQILFRGGNKKSRISIDEWAIIEEFASLNLINILITYILKDHSCIDTISQNESHIYMTFKINFGIDSKEGLPCNTITLTLDYAHHPLKEEIANYYMQDILTVFREKIKNTAYYQQKRSKQIENIKENYLKETTKQDIIDLLNNCDLETLKRMIMTMDKEEFIRLYNEKNDKTIKTLQF